MADITINGITVDPLPTGPQLLGAAPTAATALPVADTKYVLVQVDRPLGAAQRTQLEQAGAAVLEYVPENTYVCRYDPDDGDRTSGSCSLRGDVTRPELWLVVSSADDDVVPHRRPAGRRGLLPTAAERAAP